MVFLPTPLDALFIILVPLIVLWLNMWLLYTCWKAKKETTEEPREEADANDMDDFSDDLGEELDKEGWDISYSDYPGNIHYQDYHHTE